MRSASVPCADWSIRYIWNPAWLPKPWIGGGCMNITRPARCPPKRALARRTTAAADWSGSPRSAKSRSLTNSIARPWPLPENPNPSAPKVDSTAGSSVSR